MTVLGSTSYLLCNHIGMKLLYGRGGGRTATIMNMNKFTKKLNEGGWFYYDWLIGFWLNIPARLVVFLHCFQDFDISEPHSYSWSFIQQDSPCISQGNRAVVFIMLMSNVNLKIKSNLQPKVSLSLSTNQKFPCHSN